MNNDKFYKTKLIATCNHFKTTEAEVRAEYTARNPPSKAVRNARGCFCHLMNYSIGVPKSVAARFISMSPQAAEHNTKFFLENNTKTAQDRILLKIMSARLVREN